MTGEENRRFVLKGGSSLSTIKTKTREFSTHIRRDQRDKLISSKRFYNVSNVSPKTINTTDDPEYTTQKIRDVAKLIQKKSSNIEEELKYLRDAFSYTSDFVDSFLEVDNALYTLVGYLTCNDSKLQLEAAWCITNISANEHKNMMAVVRACGAYLITHLSGSSDLLQDQSALALGNMAADSHEIREILKAQGIVVPLINLIKQNHAVGIVQSALFALCNMSKSFDLISDDIMESDLPSLLLKTLANENTDLNVIGELAWFLTNFLHDDNNCEVMVCKGYIPYLVHWLCKVRPHQKEYLFAVTPLLRCLGNIICCDKTEYIKMVISVENSILLHTLSNFLMSNKRYLIKECLWVISNMFACKLPLQQYLDDVKLLLPNIVRHLTSAYEIKKEAGISLCNLLSHGPLFFEMCVSETVVRYFIDFLKLPNIVR
jgi:importin subunit alpha-1